MPDMVAWQLYGEAKPPTYTAPATPLICNPSPTAGCSHLSRGAPAPSPALAQAVAPLCLRNARRWWHSCADIREGNSLSRQVCHSLPMVGDSRRRCMVSSQLSRTGQALLGQQHCWRAGRRRSACFWPFFRCIAIVTALCLAFFTIA